MKRKSPIKRIDHFALFAYETALAESSGSPDEDYGAMHRAYVHGANMMIFRKTVIAAVKEDKHRARMKLAKVPA